MNPNETILNFLTFLARVRAMFRKVHIFAEKSPALQTVSTAVIPFEGRPSGCGAGGVTISVTLNAEILQPIDPNKKAIGMSVLLRHTGGLWVAEAEVGWSGEKIGWDPFASKEAEGASIDEIADKVYPLVEDMDLRFREEIAKMPY